MTWRGSSQPGWRARGAGSQASLSPWPGGRAGEALGPGGLSGGPGRWSGLVSTRLVSVTGRASAREREQPLPSGAPFSRSDGGGSHPHLGAGGWAPSTQPHWRSVHTLEKRPQPLGSGFCVCQAPILLAGGLSVSGNLLAQGSAPWPGGRGGQWSIPGEAGPSQVALGGTKPRQMQLSQGWVGSGGACARSWGQRQVTWSSSSRGQQPGHKSPPSFLPGRRSDAAQCPVAAAPALWP